MRKVSTVSALVMDGLRRANTGGDGAQAPSIEDYRRQAPHPDRRQGGCGNPRSTATPLVSVVTPVRNGERYLERAIDSVCTQDYDAVEHIVVDGRSTDTTLEILEARDGDISWWISEPDRGLYDAINKGISKSQGEYIKILNADDELAPGAISRSVAAAGHGISCVRGHMAVIDDGGQTIAVRTRNDRLIFIPPPFPALHPTWLLARSVYEQIGLYSCKYQIAADWDFLLRMVEARISMTYVDEVLVGFRKGGISAGYGGVWEAFEINARYLGCSVATAHALLSLAKKTGARIRRAVT